MKIYDLIRCVGGETYETIFSSPDYDEVAYKRDVAEQFETEFTYVSYWIDWHTEEDEQ